jgi:hypothetical protein
MDTFDSQHYNDSPFESEKVLGNHNFFYTSSILK